MNNQNTAPIEGATAQIVGVSVPVTKKPRNTRVKKQEPVTTSAVDETARLMADAAAYYANAHSYGFGDVKYAMLPVHLLQIDEGYQRELNRRHVDNLVGSWVDNLCEHLSVNYRDDGISVGFYVFDGQHRAAAAKKMGLMFLPCKIYHKLTYEQEALMFVEQGAEQKSINTFARFHALCEGKDGSALRLRELCVKYGVSTTFKPAGTPGALQGMTAIMNIMKKQGEHVVTCVFDTIQACGWHEKPGGYRRSVLLALRDIYSGVYTRDTQSRIVAKVAGRAPIIVLSEAQLKHPDLRPAAALTAYLVE